MFLKFQFQIPIVNVPLQNPKIWKTSALQEVLFFQKKIGFFYINLNTPNSNEDPVGNRLV